MKTIAYLRGYFAGTFGGQTPLFKERFLQADEALIVKDIKAQIAYFKKGGKILERSKNAITLSGSPAFKVRFTGASGRIDTLLAQLYQKVKKVPVVDEEVVLLAKENEEMGELYELPLSLKVERIISVYKECPPHSLYNNSYEKVIYELISNPLYFEGTRYSSSNPYLIDSVEASLTSPNVFRDLRKIKALLLMILSISGTELVKKAYPNLELYPTPFLDNLTTGL